MDEKKFQSKENKTEFRDNYKRTESRVFFGCKLNPEFLGEYVKWIINFVYLNEISYEKYLRSPCGELSN